MSNGNAVEERRELIMSTFDSEVTEAARWFATPRFDAITRLYSARQVVARWWRSGERSARTTRWRG